MAMWSVTQIVTYLKDSLDHNPFLGDLWITGEISNLSRSSAGHLYFTIKDTEGQLRCVMFRAEGRGGQNLNNGDAAIIHGRISVYPARGELQIYVDLAQPEGTGSFQLEFERLKSQLEEEGLFDPMRKRPLPRFPKTIGVVTSPTGAVFHDICNVLQRRYPLAEVLLSPALVQGDKAAPSIVEAIRVLNSLHNVDVVIVARGGGSIEELWPFNEEIVARAIYASQAPVVSGIGHETNNTISDLVADLRAPTPSAAAEIVTIDTNQLMRHISFWQQSNFTNTSQSIIQGKSQVSNLTRRIERQIPNIYRFQQRLDEFVNTLARRLDASFKLASQRLYGIQQYLFSLDPTVVLNRGYAFVRDEQEQHPLTKLNQAIPGKGLEITVSNGRFKAHVSGPGISDSEKV